MPDKTQSMRKDDLPENFDTLDDFWGFWDTHSTVDYEDAMEDVEAEIDLSASKTYFAIARNLVQPIREYARRQGVSPETLVNLWLKEKVTV
jgi:hypothetical protein